MNRSEPVACTLTATDLESQRERWLALYRDFGRGREGTEDGFRLRFRDDNSVAEELQTLIAVENVCCAWASWSVAREEDSIVMVARSTGTGVATLHAMLPAFA